MRIAKIAMRDGAIKDSDVSEYLGEQTLASVIERFNGSSLMVSNGAYGSQRQLACPT